jgi:hypothetical protein
MSEPRFRVVEGSQSGHCCFDATVVDALAFADLPSAGPVGTPRFKALCECLDAGDATAIADALNAAAARTWCSDMDAAPREGTPVDLRQGNLVALGCYWGLCDVEHTPHGAYTWTMAPSDMKPTAWRLAARVD